jgi:uncharacterized protein
MSLDIPSLLNAARGEIVGKVRLQKIVYLLDQMGMNSGYSYEYHHYGPYSAELAERVDDAVVFDQIQEISKRRASDGVPYSVYRTSREAVIAEEAIALGDMPIDQAEDALGVMERYSATVLELAATIHWLANVEKIAEWRTELLRRKGAKAERGRDRQALQLLSELGLAPE